MIVTGKAGNCDELLELLQETNPDVAFIDVPKKTIPKKRPRIVIIYPEKIIFIEKSGQAPVNLPVHAGFLVRFSRTSRILSRLFNQLKTC